MSFINPDRNERLSFKASFKIAIMPDCFVVRLIKSLKSAGEANSGLYLNAAGVICNDYLLTEQSGTIKLASALDCHLLLPLDLSQLIAWVKPLPWLAASCTFPLEQRILS